MVNQTSNSKNQSEKEKFKEDFNKRTIRFSVNILKFCEKLKSDRLLWSIIDQLIRSATSIGANIVEAKSSSSRRDYLHFFEISLKSSNETKYWLIIVKECKPEYKDEVSIFYKEVDELSRVIGSSILTLKGKK